MSRFNDACVVVTGGASGIGEATARGIVAEGGRVVIADLQEELGQSLARELGETAIEESLHHGDRDTIYLRRIGSRYVLLGVAELTMPAGIVREKAAQIAGPLAGLLGEPPEADARAGGAAVAGSPTEQPNSPSSGEDSGSGYAYDIG